MVIAALKDSLGKLGPKYEHTPLTFPQLNIEQLKKKMNLKSEAEQRGRREMPSETAKVFDDVEQRIVSFIDSEVKSATEAYHDDMSTFSSRIGMLGAEGHSSDVSAVAAGAEGDFEMMVRRDEGKLYIERTAISEKFVALSDFRKSNGLKNAAHHKESKTLAYSIAASILLIETITNGIFFAKGSESGLIGGVAMAIVFAFLNIAIAYAIGNFACRYAIHKRLPKRLYGLFLCITLPILTISLNLLVAHYRNVMEHVVDEGIINVATQAFVSFKSAPLGLNNVDSWFLFFVGLVFAIAAAIDFWKMDDPYPSYSNKTRDYNKSLRKYANHIEDSLEELSDIKEYRMEELTKCNAILNAKLHEAKSILEAQKRWKVLFAGHLTHLEDSGRQLLAYYRNMNEGERKTPPPVYFSEQWSLERPVLSESGGDLSHIIEEFQDEAEQMKASYKACLERISQGYTKAIKEYPTIDQLQPEQLKKWHLQSIAQEKDAAIAA